MGKPSPTKANRLIQSGVGLEQTAFGDLLANTTLSCRYHERKRTVRNGWKDGASKGPSQRGSWESDRQ
jgi:hypothetical protein